MAQDIRDSLEEYYLSDVKIKRLSEALRLLHYASQSTQGYFISLISDRDLSELEKLGFAKSELREIQFGCKANVYTLTDKGRITADKIVFSHRSTF